MYFRNVLEGLTIEEIIIYLRKSRSDDPTLSVSEVLAKHEQDLQELAVRLFGQKIPEKQIYREVASSETLEFYDAPFLECHKTEVYKKL